ncbi:MAG: hypothetical protein ISS19_02985 [Bacteroidales bacterium]|nr:hypothetical protein [Bacteroidales bacterium]
MKSFLREPPVYPVANTIKTSVSIGYCASIALASMMELDIPHATVYRDGNKSLIYLNSGAEMVVPYWNNMNEEIIVATIALDEEMMIMSIIFPGQALRNNQFQLLNVETIPVIIEEDRIMLVYANQDINIEGEPSINIEMGPLEMEIEISRLDVERPETEEVAILQNAWIIDVYHKGTFNQFMDDDYVITGGEQHVFTGYRGTSTDASVMQMAVIEAKLSSDCFLNPGSGFAILREIDISTSRNGGLNDLVLGTIFFTFHDLCNGKVLIPAATGNFITSSGKEYDLNLYE